MEPNLKGGPWPTDWASNLSVSFGRPGGSPVLLFGGTAVSCFPLRPLGEACDGLPVHGRLQSLAGHNGNPQEYQRLSFRQVYTEGAEALQQMAAAGQKVILGGFSGGALLSVILAARFPELVRDLMLIGYCPEVKGLGRKLLVSACGLLDWLHVTRPVLHRMSFSWKESKTPVKRDPRFREQPLYRAFSGTAVSLIDQLQSTARSSWRAVRVPSVFFHGALDGRASLGSVEKLVRKVRRRSGAELRIYPRSSHCISSGPEGVQFSEDFRDVIERRVF